MGAWSTGTTFDDPHSGQRGGFLAVVFFPEGFFLVTGCRVESND